MFLALVLAYFAVKKMIYDSEVNYNEVDKLIELVDKENNNVVLNPDRLTQVFFSRRNNLKAKYLSIWDNDFNPYYLWFFEEYMRDYPNFTNDIDKFKKVIIEKDINAIVFSKKLIGKYYPESFIQEVKKLKFHIVETEAFIVLKRRS